MMLVIPGFLWVFLLRIRLAPLSDALLLQPPRLFAAAVNPDLEARGDTGVGLPL